MDGEKQKRLIQLLGMTGSKHDGEALNAIRLANRLLGGLGITWEEALGKLNGAGRYSDEDMMAVSKASFEKGFEDGYAKAKMERFQSTGVKRTVHVWQVFAKEVRDQHFGELNDWEEEFVMSFISRGWTTPTPKQKAVFERIANKLDVECPE